MKRYLFEGKMDKGTVYDKSYECYSKASVKPHSAFKQIEKRFYKDTKVLAVVVYDTYTSNIKCKRKKKISNLIREVIFVIVIDLSNSNSRLDLSILCIGFPHSLCILCYV